MMHFWTLSTATLLSAVFFFYSTRDHRYLHSFPTRRSSDLLMQVLRFRGDIRPDVAENNRTGKGGENDQDSRPLDPRKQSDRKSTRLNSSPSHLVCRLLLEKKKNKRQHS